MFKNNLSLVRKQRKIKQTDLAESIDISPSYISKIENGVQDPSKRFAKLVCDYLKVSRDTLFPAKPNKKLELEIKNKFDNRIWYHRKIKDLNQKILSKKLGFSIAELSKIETGKKIPSADIIAKLTKILGVSKKELFPTLKNI